MSWENAQKVPTSDKIVMWENCWFCPWERTDQWYAASGRRTRVWVGLAVHLADLNFIHGCILGKCCQTAQKYLHFKQ